MSQLTSEKLIPKVFHLSILGSYLILVTIFTSKVINISILSLSLFLVTLSNLNNPNPSQGISWRQNTSMNGTLDSFNGSSLVTAEAAEQLNASLSNSPARAPDEARNKLPRPKTLLEKARSNVG